MDSRSNTPVALPDVPQEILMNAAGLPIVPYRHRPLLLNDGPAPRAAKKQKVAFSGSALDEADAKWYEDDAEEEVSPPSAAPNIYPSPLNEQTSSSSVGPIPPVTNVNRERRTLTRYNSNQVVDRYLNDIDDSV